MKRIVLIVDDDPDICWVLERLAKSLKARCLRARDGQDALQAARLNRLALVLLDAKLPDMDGLEVARQIRAVAPGVPIMLISGYFYQDDPAIQAALGQGLICGFVEKPFSHTEMIGAIGAALSSPAAQEPAGSGAAAPLAAG